MAAVSILISALLLLSPAAAELQRVQHAPKDDGSLTVLAVGDWGRGGQFNQTLVAEQVNFRLMFADCYIKFFLGNQLCTHAFVGLTN
jgi:hypothetical protein